MTQYDLSPFFIKVTHNDTHRDHIMTIPTKPNSPPIVGTDTGLLRRDGDPISFVDWFTEFSAVLKTFFHSGHLITNADFWSKPTPDDDPVWVYSIAGSVAGTATGATQYKQEIVQSYRSGLGNIAKVYILAPSADYPNDNVHALTTADAMAAYIVGPSSVWVARDTSKLIAPLKSSSKTNDKLRELELGI